MNKTYYKRLMKHAESCQEEADKTAYQLTKLIEDVSVLVSVQSICDFNLFWLYEISSVVIHDATILFLDENKKEFKRKLSISELIQFDGIITHNNINDFNHFKELVKKIKNKNK